MSDPGAHFNEAWDTRFEALGIKHLRSPAFTHPKAYEPQALLNFAISEGRMEELIDVPALKAHKTQSLKELRQAGAKVATRKRSAPKKGGGG